MDSGSQGTHPHPKDICRKTFAQNCDALLCFANEYRLMHAVLLNVGFLVPGEVGFTLSTHVHSPQHKKHLQIYGNVFSPAN